MSSSRHRAGFQTAIFFVAALLPLGFALFLLAVNEIPLWSGSWLVAAAVTSLLIGLALVISTHRKVALLLRELGQQNRELQEARLEKERLHHELRQIGRHSRTLQSNQGDQNRAVLHVAQEFAQIATEVSQTAAKAGIDDLTQQKLDFLNRICDDLVELLVLETTVHEPRQQDFVVDHELASCMEQNVSEGRLPEGFKIEHEDTDISARTDKTLFLSAIDRALLTLQPFALEAPLHASMISYMHAELEDVIQITITAKGFSITDVEADQWFSHFQLHADTSGRFLGPGLGMMIVQRYVERLGGMVTVAGEMKGTITVTLTLPLRVQQDEDENQT